MNNFTKAVKFQHPDYIPMQFHINASCWHHYPKEALWELMEEHKLLFPNFKRPAAQMNDVALRANDVLRNDVTASP